MATQYIVKSRDSSYPGEVKIILTPENKDVGDGKVHPARLSLNDSGYEPGRPDILTLNLEDMVRLGRVAQAIIDGREPNPRNYDLEEEVDTQR